MCNGAEQRALLWSVTHKMPEKTGQILFSTEGWDTISGRLGTRFFFHAALQETSKLGKELFSIFLKRSVIVWQMELVAPYTTPILISYLSITPGLEMSGPLIKWNAYVYQHGISSRICVCVHVREREYGVRWRHFVIKLTPISSRRAHETFLRLNSDLTPAAFYWYLGGAAFGAAGYARRNPPTKSQHNGAARTRQQTVAQFLSRHCQWIISSHHFAEGKKFPATKFSEQFWWLEIDGCVFNFNHNFTLSIIGVFLTTSL